MIAIWRFSERRLANLIVILCLLNGNLDLCWSLNDEGLALLRFRQSVVSDPFGALSNWNDDIGVMDPCSWYGVEYSDGNILVLILRNNSFYGIIPEVIGELKDLKLLDLGYNNFSGTLPSDLGNNLSLTILLLDNNELLGGISPKTHELKIISEIEVDESQLSNSAQRPSSGERSISWNNIRTGGAAYRRLLEDPGADLRVIRHKSSAVHAPLTSPSPTSNSPSSSPSPSPSPAPSTVPSPDLNSVPPNASRPSLSVPIPLPAESRSIPAASSNSKHHRAIMFSVAIGGPVLLFALAIGILFSQGNKAIAARPWATGLSGQLQKALVTAKLFLPHKNKPILCLILLLCS